ncbi:FAA hydrolase family protein [bacterium]|nr:FAA hydrolase family protein [bacterium]
MSEHAEPLVFAAPPAVTLPVFGTNARFPVRRIFCVGRNYADHGIEMGGDPTREPPFFFTKPADSLVESGATIPYPPATQDFHFEGELVVALGKGGTDVTEAEAPALVWGHAAGNDLTRRDLQAEAKAMRRPWDMSKGFDRSAVIGLIHPGATLPDGVLRLTVDGTVRQETRLSMMIWDVAGIIAHLSRLVTLAPGDLIYTGTPAGVGALQRGQTCTVSVDGLSPASVTIA